MPKHIQVSVDEYLGQRKGTTHDGVVYRAVSAPRSFDEGSRSARFVMTDETVDSYGDIVRAKGAALDRFNTNPICLFNHNYNHILGTWNDVKRIAKRIEGVATLAEDGTSEYVDMAFKLLGQGILRGASIGFMPTKLERRLDDDGEPLWSYDIQEWELVECSIVSIPANPAALAKSIKNGDTFALETLEYVIDNFVRTPSGLIVGKKELERHHAEATGNKHSVTIDKDLDLENTADVLEPANLAEVTKENVSTIVGKSVQFDPSHPANFGSPLDIVKDAHGEVIGSWFQPDKEGGEDIHALAVEFVTDDFSGMFRGISADRFKGSKVNEEIKVPPSDIGEMDIKLINMLAERGVVFVTETTIGEKKYGSDIIAVSWDAAEKIASERGFDETVVGQLVSVISVKDADAERVIAGAPVCMKTKQRDEEPLEENDEAVRSVNIAFPADFSEEQSKSLIEKLMDSLRNGFKNATHELKIEPDVDQVTSKDTETTTEIDKSVDLSDEEVRQIEEDAANLVGRLQDKGRIAA